MCARKYVSSWERGSSEGGGAAKARLKAQAAKASSSAPAAARAITLERVGRGAAAVGSVATSRWGFGIKTHRALLVRGEGEALSGGCMKMCRARSTESVPPEEEGEKEKR